MSFPRHAKYIDSGVGWIGSIPAHWAVMPVGFRYEVMLGKMLDEKRVTGDHLASYLRNVDVQWDQINIDDLPQMDFRGNDLERYRLAPGDLLVCEGGEVGRSAIWQAELNECYYQKALHRLRRRCQEADQPRFMFYVLRAAAMLGVFEASGGKSTIAHLTAEALRRYRFGFPPSEEQAAICTFLDRETAKIDALVEEQKRLIELLKEKRQAVISQAVTKGLDPNVPMKDSGVEWLGEVPAHWTVSNIKHIVATPVTDGPHETPNFPDEGVPFVSAEAVSSGVLDFEKKRGYISVEDHQRYALKYLPRRGDIYMIKSGATTGVTAIVETDNEFNIWSPLAVIRCNKSCDPYFVLNFMRSKNFLEAVTLNWSFGTQQNIGMGVIENLAVPVPPLAEQQRIAAMLGGVTSRLDALMDEADEAMKLLQERRSALISAAVTGKIDVRSQVARSEALAA